MSYSSNPNPRSVLDMHLDPDDYSPYSHPGSPTHDDDENASLRSQALNADGTPKRPMNAFMIFARRRRPQVSAANQMMRTGEISKILSKEWNTMPMSDKQFYLDQAKKLKENFNAKYPDYVYRRRPNNSRKKRRTEPSIRGVDAYSNLRDDSLSPHEHSPDYTHSASLSPIDPLIPNEHSVSLAAQQYRAIPYATHPHYHADAATAASSAYPYYSQSYHARHAAHYDSIPAAASFPSTSAHPTHTSPSIYHPEDDALLGTAGASFPRFEAGKLESSWGSLSARRGALHPAPLRSQHHARNWSDGSASAGAGTNNTSPSAPSFPTLVAPFYPSSGTVSPSTTSSSSVASYFGAAGDEQNNVQQQPTQQQQHSQSHSPPFPTHPRAFSGSTLGSTLALSPATTSGMWSSVRGTKSEL